MSRKARLRKQAAALRNKTEQRYIDVNQKPRILRIARVHYKRNAAAQVEVAMHIVDRNSLKSYVEKLSYNLPRFKLVHVDRMWQTTGSGYGQYWQNLIMAQAQRDGFEYHYARHIMAKGTAAEGL